MCFFPVLFLWLFFQLWATCVLILNLSYGCLKALSFCELTNKFLILLQLEDESVRFYLLLKTKRGRKEESFKSEVNRTGGGEWSVKHATIQT